MAPLPTDTNTDDDPNLDLLADVVLKSFTGSPTTIGPFEQSVLHWSVSAPSRVKILLDGAEVPTSGERWVAPFGAVQTYYLSARAGRFSKLLGFVTIHANYAACFTAESSLLDELIRDQIIQKINADTTGIQFRVVPVTVNGHTSYVRSTPRVVISEDTLSIDLQLEQREAVIPDPAVDIHVDFGIQVVPNPLLPGGARRIVAINQHIDVDVSVGPITWALALSLLLPDILQIKINQAEDQARTRAEKMIVDIMGPLDPRLVHGRNLNNFFPTPQGMEIHHARFLVDSGGLGTFAVTFCPFAIAGNPGIGSAAAVSREA